MADLDTLFVIADAGPLLDCADNALRRVGSDKLADALMKLQQDAGLELDNEMTGSFSEPPPGPQFARLRAAYEPVTTARLNILNDAFHAIREQDIREDLCDLIRKMPAQPSPAAKNVPKPN